MATQDLTQDSSKATKAATMAAGKTRTARRGLVLSRVQIRSMRITYRRAYACCRFQEIHSRQQSKQIMNAS